MDLPFSWGNTSWKHLSPSSKEEGDPVWWSVLPETVTSLPKKEAGCEDTGGSSSLSCLEHVHPRQQRSHTHRGRVLPTGSGCTSPRCTRRIPGSLQGPSSSSAHGCELALLWSYHRSIVHTFITQLYFCLFILSSLNTLPRSFLIPPHPSPITQFLKCFAIHSKHCFEWMANLNDQKQFSCWFQINSSHQHWWDLEPGREILDHISSFLSRAVDFWVLYAFPLSPYCRTIQDTEVSLPDNLRLTGASFSC